MIKLQTNLLLAVTLVPVLCYAQAPGPTAAANLQQASRYDLYQLADHGDATKVNEVIAEFRRRAAAGVPQAASDLDGFLAKRAQNGDDAAVSELLGRSKPGDKNENMLLVPAAVKGSQVALEQLRSKADSAAARRDKTEQAETTFDYVLSQLAAAGDTAALAELRGRVETGSKIDRLNKMPFLEVALEKLAALGNQAALAELRRDAEGGDFSAQNGLDNIYYYGTPAVKRDIGMAAHVEACPVPDETIIASCREVDMNALPTPVKQVMKQLKCDDGDPSPVAISLGGGGAPQYKVSCYEPPHGPSDAVVIGLVRGRWKDISAEGDLDGYSDQCAGFFPLKTSHAGFHDLCLSDRCEPRSPTSRGQKALCKKLIWQFDGGRYRQR